MQLGKNRSRYSYYFRILLVLRDSVSFANIIKNVSNIRNHKCQDMFKKFQW